MENFVTDSLYEYAVQCRRHLHQYPEVGFEMPMTAAFIKDELRKMGLEGSEQYGPHSVTVEIGPEGKKVLAFRADTDALPVLEKTGLPYASKIEGVMHACGHDTHTGILLAVAKVLKANEDRLPCRIRLIFQPNEEGAQSGAKMMVDMGVMDGVDAVVCTHCENTMDVGLIGAHPGDYMAACAPITLRFLGKTSHATLPDGGVDAIAMAYEAYGRFKELVKTLAGDRPYIWSVGTFQGGTAHNVIADECTMDISFRFYDYEFCEAVHRGVLEICEDITKRFGGKYDLDWHVSTGAVFNDLGMTERFWQLQKASGLEVIDVHRRMSSEDFGWYLTKVPGMIFRYGTRNEAKGCVGVAHQNDFIVDEEGMKYAIAAFINLALHADIFMG